MLSLYDSDLPLCFPTQYFTIKIREHVDSKTILQSHRRRGRDRARESFKESLDFPLSLSLSLSAPDNFDNPINGSMRKGREIRRYLDRGTRYYHSRAILGSSRNPPSGMINYFRTSHLSPIVHTIRASESRLRFGGFVWRICSGGVDIARHPARLFATITLFLAFSNVSSATSSLQLSRLATRAKCLAYLREYVLCVY